jgi:hypothetical protein
MFPKTGPVPDGSIVRSQSLKFTPKAPISYVNDIRMLWAEPAPDFEAREKGPAKIADTISPDRKRTFHPISNLSGETNGGYSVEWV